MSEQETTELLMLDIVQRTSSQLAINYFVLEL
jgi:hypothetical protein